MRMTRHWLSAFFGFTAMAAASVAAAADGHYLFAWTGAPNGDGNDFLAVIDADPASPARAGSDGYYQPYRNDFTGMEGAWTAEKDGPLPHNEVHIDWDVPITMSDGTVLKANIYRPMDVAGPAERAAGGGTVVTLTAAPSATSTLKACLR